MFLDFWSYMAVLEARGSSKILARGVRTFSTIELVILRTFIFRLFSDLPNPNAISLLTSDPNSRLSLIPTKRQISTWSFLFCPQIPKSSISNSFFLKIGSIWETCGPQGAPRVIWATWAHFIDATLEQNSNLQKIQQFYCVFLKVSSPNTAIYNNLLESPSAPGVAAQHRPHYQNRQNPYR